MLIGAVAVLVVDLVAMIVYTVSDICRRRFAADEAPPRIGAHADHSWPLAVQHPMRRLAQV